MYLMRKSGRKDNMTERTDSGIMDEQMMRDDYGDDYDDEGSGDWGSDPEGQSPPTPGSVAAPRPWKNLHSLAAEGEAYRG